MSKNPKLPLLHQLHLCIGQKAKEELGIRIGAEINGFCGCNSGIGPNPKTLDWGPEEPTKQNLYHCYPYLIRCAGWSARG